MDSEQVLLSMFKQQHYDSTRFKMQKMVVLFSAIACSCGVAVMSVFYIDLLYVYIFAGAVVWAGITMLLYWLKAFSFNIASLVFMIYICFVLTPVFWYLTGITGAAPYVSLIILVAILSMFTGNILKRLFFVYLVSLLALTVYSAIVQIPTTANLPSLMYTLIAFLIAVILISSYMLSKQRKFEQMNDQFLRSSFKDELTRLLNRKVLDIIIEYEESKYKENKSDYILVMLDVDKFKQMNDEHGHVFGDIILRNIAKCINDKVRSSDFVVRYGGDEFLVVQTDASEQSVRLFVERIEEAMKSSCYMDVVVTVSYGFAARSECKTPEDVLALADKRLYEKKEACNNK